MLKITRAIGESFTIGANIRITITGMRGREVRVTIEAPQEMSIERDDMRKRKVLPNPCEAPT